jgi:hypothetical protein
MTQALLGFAAERNPMKQKVHIISLLSGMALGAVVMLTVAATNNERVKWEYKIQYFGGTSHVGSDGINALGEEGWEVVGGFTNEEGKNPGFVLKRRK